MKNQFMLLVATVALLCCGASLLAQPSWEWAVSGAGKYAALSDRGWGMDLDASGNTYVTGQFFDTITFGGITLTSDDSAAANSEIFLIKTDASGNFVWGRTVANSNPYDFGRDAMVTNTGDVIITGEFNGTASAGGFTVTQTGGMKSFIAKYSASGTVQWAKQTKMTAAVCKLAADGNEFYVSGGASIGRFTASGDTLWVRSVPFSAFSGVSVDASGNAYVTGFIIGTATFGAFTLSSTSLFEGDIFVAKYDRNGNVLWAVDVGGNQYDQAYAIAATPDGGAVVTGTVDTFATFGATTLSAGRNNRMFLAKISSLGVWEWAKEGLSDISCTGWDVDIDNSGNAFVTGIASGNFSLGGENRSWGFSVVAHVTKWDPLGQMEWMVNPTNTGFGSYSNSIEVNGSGSAAWVTGFFMNTEGFGSDNLTASGFGDVFIAKIGQPTALEELDPVTRPTSFMLQQNYPNPFNPSTTIEFALPRASHVRLEVFDLLGRAVRTLVDQPLANRAYSVTWDGRSSGGEAMPSGVYFYRLVAGEITEMKKMVLLK